MSDLEENSSDQERAEAEDTAADTKVILIVFVAAVLLAVHLVSGFSFDF